MLIAHWVLGMWFWTKHFATVVETLGERGKADWFSRTVQVWVVIFLRVCWVFGRGVALRRWGWGLGSCSNDKFYYLSLVFSLLMNLRRFWCLCFQLYFIRFWFGLWLRWIVISILRIGVVNDFSIGISFLLEAINKKWILVQLRNRSMSLLAGRMEKSYQVCRPL